MGHRGLRKGPDSSRGWGRGWGTLPASNRFMALPPLPSLHPGPVISKLVTAPPGSSAAASSVSVGLSFSVSDAGHLLAASCV